MEPWTIYYNPKCGTCRKVLAALEEKGVKPLVVEYLKNPPTTEELDGVLKKAGLEPEQVARKKEGRYSQLKLAERKLSRAEWLKILVDNPILIERPLVVKGGKAILARPPEKLEELF